MNRGRPIRPRYPTVGNGPEKLLSCSFNARSGGRRPCGSLERSLYQPPTSQETLMSRVPLGLSAAAVIVVGLAAAPALAEPPAPPSTSTARTELAALTVAAPHSM